jgi:hypothetical protein
MGFGRLGRVELARVASKASSSLYCGDAPAAIFWGDSGPIYAWPPPTPPPLVSIIAPPGPGPDWQAEIAARNVAEREVNERHIAQLRERDRERQERPSRHLIPLCLRCPLRNKQRVPSGEVEIRQAGLVHGRDLGRPGQSGLIGDRIDLDAARADMGQRARWKIEHQVEPTGDEVLHLLRIAAIEDELVAGVGRLLEEEASDVP